MPWNHRVVKKKCPFLKEIYYEIHEAFYWGKKVTKKPSGVTTNPVSPSGATLKDLKEILKWMLSSLEAPVIDWSKKPILKRDFVGEDKDKFFARLLTAFQGRKKETEEIKKLEQTVNKLIKKLNNETL